MAKFDDLREDARRTGGQSIRAADNSPPRRAENGQDSGPMATSCRQDPGGGGQLPGHCRRRSDAGHVAPRMTHACRIRETEDRRQGVYSWMPAGPGVNKLICSVAANCCKLLQVAVNCCQLLADCSKCMRMQEHARAYACRAPEAGRAYFYLSVYTDV